MKVIVVTGSCGLIGSETVRHYASRGWSVVGIDNNMRRTFFGVSSREQERLEGEFPNYRHYAADIRDYAALEVVFRQFGHDIRAVVHTAGQPSHDWAASDPRTDFGVNATGTLNLLELTRLHCPGATFVFTSTNKVYGDLSDLFLDELDTRYEIGCDVPGAAWEGVNETARLDQTMHSVFGASKVAADVMVQEYHRYFGLNTVVFRCGCVTGPAHAGAEQHGFLAYLVKRAMRGDPYTIHGYQGKQVRDQIHATDLVAAFDCVIRDQLIPRPDCLSSPVQRDQLIPVYNMGGGRDQSASVLETIAEVERVTGKRLDYVVSPTPRKGDHQWYISDTSRFERDYPNWRRTIGLGDMIHDIARAV